MKQHQAERLRDVIAATGATVEMLQAIESRNGPNWVATDEFSVKVGNMVIVTEREYAMALLAVAERMR